VHIQEHGVDSPFSLASPLHVADDGLAAFADVFDGHSLLPHAAMPLSFAALSEFYILPFLPS
jgi:hypothetical protein